MRRPHLWHKTTRPTWICLPSSAPAGYVKVPRLHAKRIQEFAEFLEDRPAAAA
jgi:hypothetical protein